MIAILLEVLLLTGAISNLILYGFPSSFGYFMAVAILIAAESRGQEIKQAIRKIKEMSNSVRGTMRT